MNFDKKVKEIIDDILNLYRKKNWTKKELRDFVNEKLQNYSKEVRQMIEEALYKELGEFYYKNNNPELAITPVMLSERVYKNSKMLAKEINVILEKSIKANETVKTIAMKLYEGYDFKDKEVLNAAKVLPKYLQKAFKNRDKSIMKQVEKLRTKPLRIAYKDIVRRLDVLNDKALEEYMRTAYHEKMRYYAKRIADTETHRAMMTKRAYEYLNDNEIEFVRFQMSIHHPKTDICDFYANLDMGYGRGIVPKREMRSTPLHPHCRCIYAPYYGKVNGKKKSWKEAVHDTMNEFDEREQREILGTYDMLNRFKAGENIEKIFNTIRPKYKIKKYIDLFNKSKSKLP